MLQTFGVIAILSSLILLSSHRDLAESSFDTSELPGADARLMLGFASCLVAAIVTIANEATAIAIVRDEKFSAHNT